MFSSRQMKLIHPQVSQELAFLGRYLRALRKKRSDTIEQMCERLNMNPRTIIKIEKGDPTVSMGAVMQYLNIVGLISGVADRIISIDNYTFVSPGGLSKGRKAQYISDDEVKF